MNKKTTTLLCILDGLGLNPRNDSNSFALASKPTLDRLFKTCPHSTLTTSGEAVGLPAGQMGNSEVGHLNIGAGRVVEQSLLRISRALSGTFLDTSKEYKSFISNTSQSPTLHVIGLFSDGGVHSQEEHLKLLLPRLAKDFKGSTIALHLISDGRDVSPNSFITSLEQLLTWLKPYPKVSIASICGRFFAMDRDKRWERVEKGYQAIALAQGENAPDPVAGVKESYARGLTDEFIEPLIIKQMPICENDALLFWNFREDRMREIVASLCTKNFAGFTQTHPIPAPEKVLCFTEYDATFGLPYLFTPVDIQNHLGEVVSKNGLHQLRVAETEKYPHVTYFLNGGIEIPQPNEDRKMVPSPRDVKTYDLKPEMSARGVADLVIEGINSGSYQLIVVNFANCDMVGHTGNLAAAIKAVEVVDTCLGEVLAALEAKQGQAIIIADHGNCEQMIDYSDGTPHTAHTTYPVPIIAVGNSYIEKLKDGGALCDVAPTLLKMMEIEQPTEMTGQALF